MGRAARLRVGGAAVHRPGPADRLVCCRPRRPAADAGRQPAVLRAARRAAAAPGLGGAGPSLARLAGDYLAAHNQIVLAAETFTDPARHTGACYAAAAHPGRVDIGVCPRRRGARLLLPRPGQTVLAAGGARRRPGRAGGAAPSVLFGPPPPAAWLDLSHGQVASLRAHLGSQLADPRSARGIRHDHAATAVIAAAALLAGHRSPAGIAGYAGRLGQDALKVFGARWSARHGSYIPPSESGFRRFLGLPPGALTGAAAAGWPARPARAPWMPGRPGAWPPA